MMPTTAISTYILALDIWTAPIRYGWCLLLPYAMHLLISPLIQVNIRCNKDDFAFSAPQCGIWPSGCNRKGVLGVAFNVQEANIRCNVAIVYCQWVRYIFFSLIYAGSNFVTICTVIYFLRMDYQAATAYMLLQFISIF